MIVDSALYRDGARVPTGEAVTALAALRARVTEPGDFVWVGLHEPVQAELDEVAKVFGLHPLAVEDAVKAAQRPKLDLYDDSIFLTCRTLWYFDERDAVETGEIHLFLGHDFVITIRHGDGLDLRQTRATLEAQGGILTAGPAMVAHAVIDLVVDDYERVAGALEIDVDEVESSVFSDHRTRDSARIYALKRELAEVRRAVLPLRDPVRRLASGDLTHVPEITAPSFRDVADHLNRVAEAIDALDGMLSAAFEAHLASISVQQNEDMRKISAGVGLVAMPTLIAGVYGMNFDHMPELHWIFGYPAAIALMVLSSLGLWIFFKRSGWL